MALSVWESPSLEINPSCPISRVNSAQTILHLPQHRPRHLHLPFHIPNPPRQPPLRLHVHLGTRLKPKKPLPQLHPSPHAHHPLPAPGAVAGLFTSYSSPAKSDIESLTQIRYSNQPDYNAEFDSAVPGASTQPTLPASKHHTSWLGDRTDWCDGVSRWHVDDTLVLEKTLNEPSGLVLNLCGPGEGQCSGDMSVGVQWIEMVFKYVGICGGAGAAEGGGCEEGAGWEGVYCGTGKKREQKCKVACVGFPEKGCLMLPTASGGAAATFASSSSYWY